ncbi:MAG: Maf family protein [Acidimicrobiales bacterium]|nr:Maf family protein [Acidimicrobiales bacterium]
MTRVILASGSPRRRELLGEIGIDPIVRPADVDETPRPDESPETLVARLARSKATAVDADATDLVIAADTVVAVGGDILGKPDDEAHAAAMLRRLSDTTHRVITGVHLRRDNNERSAVEATSITFRPLSDAEIGDYVATGEPMDKAGSFAIQGLAADFVTAIDGSHSNVVGLPLDVVIELAADLGVTFS